MDTQKLQPGSQESINVLVTSEKGSKDYCEFDHASGAFILRKVLSRVFPGFYGFVPGTHNIDAEPLHAIVLTVEKLRQDMVVQVRPIGIIRLSGRVPEDVLITVLINDSVIKTQDLLTLNEEELEELKNFLEELKGERFQEVFGAEHARRSFERSVELYKKEFQ